MTKKILRQKIIDIILMDKSDVIRFQQTLSLSDLDAKSRGFLQRTIDLRLDCLKNEDVSPLVVEAELTTGEI